MPTISEMRVRGNIRQIMDKKARQDVEKCFLSFLIIGTNPDRYITYNIDTRTLVFPPNTAFYYKNGNYNIPEEARTLELYDIIQQNYAASLWVLNDNTIEAVAFNAQPSANKEAAFLGYVYGNNVSINGAYNERIQIIDSNGNQYPQNEQLDGGSYVVVHDGVFEYGDFGGIGSVIYDRENDTISLSGDAYCVYRGKSLSNRPMTIDLSDLNLSQTVYAFKLYIKPTGEIYGTAWNGTQESPADDFIGYGYNTILWINGVPQFAIEDVSKKKTVFCFGDSITAGHMTTETYEMFYHEWDRNIHCKDYGVGGSGYAYSNPNGTTPNGIEYKYRDQDLVAAPSDNTLLGMMEYVNSAMGNITLFGGTNDYGTNQTESDFTTAVQNTLDYAMTKTQHILVITPIKRYYPNTDGETPNSVGMKLSDYANIIKRECALRGIICVDGYEIGLNPSVPGHKTAFVPDGLHPNKDGHLRIARYTYSRFLEAIGK